MYIIEVCPDEDQNTLGVSQFEGKKVSGYERDLHRCRSFACLYSSKPFHSTEPRIATCRYSGLCAQETDSEAAGSEKKETSN